MVAALCWKRSLSYVATLCNERNKMLTDKLFIMINLLECMFTFQKFKSGLFDHAYPDFHIPHTIVQVVANLNRTTCILLCVSHKSCQGIAEFAHDVKGVSHCGLILHEEDPGRVIRDNVLYLENVSAIWEKTGNGLIQVEDDGKCPTLLNRSIHHLICPTKILFHQITKCMMVGIHRHYRSDRVNLNTVKSKYKSLWFVAFKQFLFYLNFYLDLIRSQDLLTNDFELTAFNT